MICDRRTFVATAAGLTLSARTARLAAQGANDRVRVAVIGTGSRARGLMTLLKKLPGNEMTAVCDVYEPNLLQGAEIAGPNAIKFSGRGGKVQVSARPEGQMWRIDVTDEGIGIPAGELDTLFGRFVRGTNARLAGLPGTGLGLSVVKAIAELHSGRVEVESTVELGSTFSVFLPVLDQLVTA